MDAKYIARKCKLPPYVLEGVDNLVCCMGLYVMITCVSLNNPTSL